MKRNEYKQRFDEDLQQFCEQEVDKLRPLFFDTMLEWMVSYVTKYQQGWKRIRPYLIWLFGSQFGVPEAELQDLCLAVELVHLYAIIDDDIMDKGTTRHSIPTYHKYIESLYASAPHSLDAETTAHVWVSQTILIGSLVYTRANRLVAMSTYNTETKALFYTLLEEVNYWQMIDVHLSHIPTVDDKSSIERKDKLKSWNYTFLRPICIGAASAQALDNEAFSTLGSALWLAFQMRDDLLDIADPNSNKTYFSDLQEGNQTVVLFEALQRMNANDAATLLQYRGKPISKDIAQHLYTIIEQSGAIDATKKQINNLLDQADEALGIVAEWKPELYQWVKEIIDFLRV